ncbi:MAG TPA: hypothetical protein VFC19_14285 [Candidatus Limnocylindrales bacterium]|nr:hypothetical protein [Candidatus Limnocylindrales bacterium]
MVFKSRLRLAVLAACLVAAPIGLAPGPAQGHNGCNQPSGVRIVTSPNRGSLPGSSPLIVDVNTTLFFTGIAHAGFPSHWGFYDPVTQRRFFRSTQPAEGNCVIRHEPEAVLAGVIGVGTYQVWAIYVRWEDQAHAETSVLVGTATINP